MPAWLLASVLAPVALWAAIELRKFARTGVIDDGGDWDWGRSDGFGFWLHAMLLIAPIFGFLAALFAAALGIS